VRSLKDRKEYIGMKVKATVDMGSTAKAGEKFVITEELVEKFDPHYWLGNGSVVPDEKPPASTSGDKANAKPSKPGSKTKARSGDSGASDGN